MELLWFGILGKRTHSSSIFSTKFKPWKLPKNNCSCGLHLGYVIPPPSYCNYCSNLATSLAWGCRECFIMIIWVPFSIESLDILHLFRTENIGKMIMVERKISRKGGKYDLSQNSQLGRALAQLLVDMKQRASEDNAQIINIMSCKSVNLSD